MGYISTYLRDVTFPSTFRGHQGDQQHTSSIDNGSDFYRTWFDFRGHHLGK
jgi:hypothetical protein